ncbi:MAG TPA: hypothetical protein VFF52_07830 [Isosphaeraceae bacterium]|nr:hypothetical protein [Isosphaeraceae bacterium]
MEKGEKQPSRMGQVATTELPLHTIDERDHDPGRQNDRQAWKR